MEDIFESPQEPNEPVEQIELTDDHYKAAMDRCWIAFEFIGSTVMDHPVIAQTPVWKAMATFAQDIMVSLYTELGSWKIEPKEDGSELATNIREKVNEFVNELNDRYIGDISNKMLKHLLIAEIKRLWATKRKNAIIVNVVYDAGCYVFESLLEYRCEAGGNGHHVAQNLASKFI